jgi:hypothetical protein
VGGPLRGVDAWLGPFREQWERRFDGLDSFLEKNAKAPRKKSAVKKKEHK